MSATKGASVGSPIEVLKVVVRAWKSMTWESRMLFEHRHSVHRRAQSAGKGNGHIFCYCLCVVTCTLNWKVRASSGE
jgi:hypothetical protein